MEKGEFILIYLVKYLKIIQNGSKIEFFDF